MYIRLNMFSVGSGRRSEFERLADRLAPIFRARKGFKSVTFFEADAAAGEYGSFSICETRRMLRPPTRP
jgi:heme-degrading monooxygenase HmoA